MVLLHHKFSSAKMDAAEFGGGWHSSHLSLWSLTLGKIPLLPMGLFGACY